MDWVEYLEVIYHDFLVSRDPNLPQDTIKPKDKALYESNFSEIEALFNQR